jgi:hypothetical protein
MDPVAAADGRRVFVLQRAPLERGEQRVDVFDEDVGGARKLHRETGVEHIRRSHSLMHETRILADELREMGEKSDDVVLDLALDRVDARDVESRLPALFPDRARRRFRNHAQLRHGVGGMRLDLEPDAEPGFRRPDRRHCLAGVARNHPGKSRSVAGVSNA